MKIHFIGIGGIGVSALAQYYLATGHKVSGSDLVSTEITELLKLPRRRTFGSLQDRQGAKIFIGQKAGNLSKDTNLVIYSPAVKPDNPELKQAQRLGIKCQTYPQALGELTRKYFTIAVAGTHGKSTTTAMIALILIKAGLDPTVIIGTKVPEFNKPPYNIFSAIAEKMLSQEGNNFYMGHGKYLVIEACEYKESFLNYSPKMIVLTNIEREHLDYFKNLKNILKAFKKFIGYLPKDGILVANRDDENIQRILDCKLQITNYKQSNPTASPGFRPVQPNSKFPIQKYSLNQEKDVHKLKRILKVPGEHNVYNALAALTTARALNIPDKISLKALSEYKGSWRRFEEQELIIKNLKLKIIQDYAHHPTEIKATLKAAREKFPEKKIWCVFQPHQYQRTFYLFNDFVKVFSRSLKNNWIDKLIITDIYDVAGREEKKIKKEISSKKIVEEIIENLKLKIENSALYIPNLLKIEKYLRQNLKVSISHDRAKLKPFEVIIIMGAGDIYKLNDKLQITNPKDENF